MFRPFVGVLVLMICGSGVLAQLPTGASSASPGTGPVTRPASGPATTQSTQSTQPTTTASRAERDERRREDTRRKDEDVRLAVLLASIPGDADSATSDVNTIASKYASDAVTSVVDNALPPLLGIISPQLEENDRLLTPATSLETLRSLEGDWNQYAGTLDGWADDLRRRDEVLKAGIAKLTATVDDWRGRRRAIRDVAERKNSVEQFDPDAIRQLGEQSKVVRDRAQTLLDNLNWEHNKANSLLISISAAKARVRDARTAVQEAQRKARDRLLVQDSPVLWNALLHSEAPENVAEQGRNTLDNQWRVLQKYVQRQKPSYLLHLAGVMALAAVLIWLRRQTRQWTANDPTLLNATRVFQTPIATAITVSMTLSPWIYPAAPRLFWGILGTAVLVPTIIVLRPLIERSLRPLLYGLAGASFVNLLLAIVAALPLVYRLLFLAQMGGAAIFFVWFLRTWRGAAGEVEGNFGVGIGGDPARPLRKAAVLGARFGLAVTVVAFGANVFGFVSLSRLIGNALLTSAYLGVLLDTSVHVIDALLLGASHIRPINTLGMVQRHRPLLIKRLHWLMCVIAVGLWGYFTLDALSVRPTVVAQAKAVWAWPKDADEVFGTPVKVRAAATPRAAMDAEGDAATQPAETAPRAPQAATPPASVDGTANPADDTLTNSLYIGGILSFGLTLAASYFLSRFIAFLLDEDVYPRLKMARGMPYAISTLLRYVVLAIGFTLAIAKLGYNDMTKLTILVSAFGVGLGFGMQNIVNNFVSGLILLFERPVQVGDVIELDNITGVVTRIGIRASVIRTPVASEVIIPNGRLISDRVINWTLSNRQRGVEIPVTVVASVEAQKLIQILTSTAKAHPLVASYPSPQAFFTDFSGGGMRFEVRAWTNRFEDWIQVRSDLAVAINAALLKEHIELK